MSEVTKYVEDAVASVTFECSDTLPNIFLIGDSIRRGYCKTVKAELKGKAEVFYVDDNCRSTQYVIFSIRKWAEMFSDRKKVDIVHFNCGHWDIAHFSGCPESLTSEEEYAKNIGKVIFLIRKFFPNAKIIFATTTPMDPSGKVGGNPRSNAEVERYNEIATEVCRSEGIEINDIHAATRDWGEECFKDYCHLTPEAFAEVGKMVAKKLCEVQS
ncbi:MAG: hypothetical protein J6S14_21125 [Clostridia bacterium]|nr:hypothetical protein [Clostridia bacterium]